MVDLGQQEAAIEWDLERGTFLSALYMLTHLIFKRVEGIDTTNVIIPILQMHK